MYKAREGVAGCKRGSSESESRTLSRPRIPAVALRFLTELLRMESRHEPALPVLCMLMTIEMSDFT